MLLQLFEVSVANVVIDRYHVIIGAYWMLILVIVTKITTY